MDNLAFKILFDHSNWMDRNMQHYRSLFFALEAALTVVVINLKDIRASFNIDRATTIISIFGIITGILWIVLCDDRAKIVNYYRGIIKNEVEHRFKADRDAFLPLLGEGKFENEHSTIRFLFNIAVPIVFMIFWFIILSSHVPLISTLFKYCAA